jgi:hypothetical protein
MLKTVQNLSEATQRRRTIEKAGLSDKIGPQKTLKPYTTFAEGTR